eukprot:s4393_g5.t1
MKEVEDSERKKARLRAVMTCGVIAENDYEKKIAELQAMFPEVPLRILERIPGEKEWDPVQVPVNRRRRRQIERAKAIIVNMCSGTDTKRWMELETDGVVVLNIDVLLGTNALDPHVAGWIESIIDTGKVIMWTSGPPCRTVSLCRSRGYKDGGPKPPRKRKGQERFGVAGISSYSQDLADHDAALWLKNLWYMRRVSERNPSAEVLVEQPQDPEEWLPNAEECPSFLVWPETEKTIQDLKLNKVVFCQGEVGHQTDKPTTLLTTIPELKELDGLNKKTKGQRWPDELEDRMKMAKDLAAWAPGMVQLIKIAARRKTREEIQVKTITAKEKEAKRQWRTRVEMNHLPYRRDCGVCLEMMGKDRPRLRQKCPEAFTLALDIGGPFVSGQDQVMHHQPKYFLIATMTVPMHQGRPLVEELRKMGGDTMPMEDLPQPPLERAKEAVDPHDKAQDLRKAKEAVDPLEEAQGGRGEQEAADHQKQEAPDPQGERGAEKDREKQRTMIEARDEARRLFEEDGEIEDPFEIQQEVPEPPISEATVKELDEENQRWRDFIAQTEHRPIQTLTMAIPIQSRKNQHVIPAVSQVMARMKALHIPVIRIHTDRAQEFCGKAFTAWIQQRDLYHTTTAGDEPSSNARAENELKIIKGRARVLMKSAKCEVKRWPLAIRYASEERLRCQLRSCGVPAPPMLPFGVRAYAKQKAWQNKHAMWRSPMVAVRAWGPAHDMSMTSKGYYLEIEETGKFMRSTIVVVPTDSPAIADADEDPDQPMGYDLPYSPSIAEEQDEDGGEEVGKAGEIELELHVPVSNQQIPRYRIYQKRPPMEHENKETEPTLKHVKGRAQQAPLVAGREQVMGGGVAPCQPPGKDSDAIGEEDCPHPQAPDPLEDLMVLEHSGLTKWAREERQIATDTGTMRTVLEVEATVEKLEEILEERRQIKRLWAHQEEPEEVLQTRVVPPEEVRADLEGWEPIFRKEYEALTAGPVTPITEEEVRKMEERGERLEILPAKAIATKKPPNRKKARVVVCGNYTEDRDESNVSVGGVCSMTVRGLIHVAACKGWKVGSIDVKGAFLQAPRRQKKTTTIVQPPRLLQQLRIISAKERWKVNCALYGFVESPGDWSEFRDEGLEEMRWTNQGRRYRLQRTAEQHLWKVLREDEREDVTAGWIAVYVDDFLVTMDGREIDGAFQAIKKKWTCSEEEKVTQERPMRFCGYEIQATEEGGFHLTQSGYLQDVLKKYDLEGEEGHPVPKVEDEPDETEQSAEDIKKAQMICGEVQWVAGRTRPDISYGAGLMARLIHRRPAFVIKVGMRMLKYLGRTKERGLRYQPMKEDEKEWTTLKVSADTSFAPPHEKYRSVQAVVVEHGPNILAWESSRQAFITQSTAEAELLGYNEAFQLGEATAALCSVFEIKVKKKLRGDCKAALAQIQGDTGPWRTRHLRLRSAKIREALRKEEFGWSAEHCSGTMLNADGMTKALQGQAYAKFVQLLGMKDKEQTPTTPEVKTLYVQDSLGKKIQACLAAGLAMLDYKKPLAALILLAATLLSRGRAEDKEGQNREEPKIRAFRVRPTATASSAAARGRDAMALADRRSQTNQRNEENDQEGGVKEDEASQSGESWSVVEGSVTEAFERMSLQSERENLQGDCEPQLDKDEEERLKRHEPWKLPRYQTVKAGKKDVWDTTLGGYGWMVKVHMALRKRMFHPVHKTTPFDCDQIFTERTTSMITPEKTIMVDRLHTVRSAAAIAEREAPTWAKLSSTGISSVLAEPLGGK